MKYANHRQWSCHTFLKNYYLFDVFMIFINTNLVYNGDAEICAPTVIQIIFPLIKLAERELYEPTMKCKEKSEMLSVWFVRLDRNGYHFR